MVVVDDEALADAESRVDPDVPLGDGDQLERVGGLPEPGHDALADHAAAEPQDGLGSEARGERGVGQRRVEAEDAATQSGVGRAGDRPPEGLDEGLRSGAGGRWQAPDDDESTLHGREACHARAEPRRGRLDGPLGLHPGCASRVAPPGLHGGRHGALGGSEWLAEL